MARQSPHEHHKPAVFRYLREGFKVYQIRKLSEFADLPKSTLYDWAKEFRTIEQIGGVPEPVPESIPEFRVRLAKVDPEDPVQKVINALWDVAANPGERGAAIAVQAYNAILKGIALQHELLAKQMTAEMDVNVSEMSEAELEKIANGS